MNGTLTKIESGTIRMKIQIGDNLSQSERLALLSPEELQLKMETERDSFFEYLGFIHLPGNNEVSQIASHKYRNEFLKVLPMSHREITCKDEIIDHILNLYHLSKIMTGLIMKHGLVESFKSYKIEKANRWKTINVTVKK